MEYIKTCSHCGTLFTAKKPYSKYCSNICKGENFKKFRNKSFKVINFYRNLPVKEEVLVKLKNWLEIPDQQKQEMIDKASLKEAIFKLKELGYPESLAFKPLSFSEDGKLMIMMNLIQQYKIEMLKTSELLNIKLK